MAILAISCLMPGCAEAQPKPIPIQSRPWNAAGFDGIEVRTPHYRVMTTVRDPAVIDRLTRVLESVYVGYAALIPAAAGRVDPAMEVVLFEKPEEWEAYTTRLTGRDAPVYLSVGSGGYTFNDQVVCWLFNESDLWSVVAHEGFHQYIARTLPLRLPPALEEGMATTFESVVVSPQQVTIDRRSNPRRQLGLINAAEAGALIPLNELVRAHAGDVAGRDAVMREGFYAQVWALARLLLEDPQYHSAFRQIMIDLRDGRATPVVGRGCEGNLYQPSNVQPLLMRYFGKDWPAFERSYKRFIERIMHTNPASE